MYFNVGLLYTTRNYKLLVFLLPKAAKGTKNAFAPHLSVDPLTACRLKVINGLSPPSLSTPPAPYGYPNL
jgi:hypothetical protein